MDEARAMIEVLKALAGKDTAAFDEDELRMVIQEAREIAAYSQAILESKQAGTAPDVYHYLRPSTLAALVADLCEAENLSPQTQAVAEQAYAQLVDLLGETDADKAIDAEFGG